MTLPRISLDNLTVTYGRHPAVHHVQGCFAAGSLTAIVGPNGAGKSTLMKAIAGLLAPAEGCVRWEGLDRYRDIAYLPQQAEIDRSFPITVRDTVATGCWREIGAFRGMTPALRGQVLEALALVGLEGFEHRVIGSLSAGQFQRALFARLLLQRTAVVLLDEPFSAIDARTTVDLLALVQQWHNETKTVIAVLHDIGQVRAHFPTTLLLARELVAWGPTQEVLAPANLLIMQHMSEQWDDGAAICRRKEG
jgi:zinc/manganese transport system ATP-binding protein